MYGLVNRAVKELIISSRGEDTWNEVRLKAGVTDQEFIAMESYPDAVTYDLVGSAAELLDTSAEELLRQFGQHWILYTAKEGYGALLDTWGDNVPEFLGNLNALHARLRLAMPHLRHPSFEVVDPGEGQLTLRYWSERASLAPMEIGILEGLGKKFSTPVVAELTSAKSDVQEFDEFAVRWRVAAEAGAESAA